VNTVDRLPEHLRLVAPGVVRLLDAQVFIVESHSDPDKHYTVTARPGRLGADCTCRANVVPCRHIRKVLAARGGG
jgi:SWIM zinc finger